ncbi:histidine kinase dimerization/phosphoacceptor domain -containing protein [Dyadobacter subterraneus]|uniref:histidine kinase n=1 Tax=Dyadobacter subterraneus TaxID=2773304 RepID=A0ABR9WBE3_9BACT|nr:sensor histidine kinase [Dyadobacter subterraneus]MBE9461676.1 sensor histidine kinase [Dyadobacter subterraneus]
MIRILKNKFRLITFAWLCLLITQSMAANGQVLKNAPVDYYSTDMKRVLALETGYYINAVSQGQIDTDSAMIMACEMFGLSRLLPYNEGYISAGGPQADALINAGKIGRAKNLLKIKTGEEKLRLLFDLANYYLFKPGAAKNDLDSAGVYMDEVEKITAGNEFKNWRNECLRLKGKFYYQTGNITESQKYFGQLVKSCRESKDAQALAKALADQGIGLPFNSPDKLQIYQQALSICQKHKLKIQELQLTARIVTIYFVADLNAAEKGLLNFLKLGQELGFRHLQYTHNVLAYVYLQKTEYLKAMDHARLSIRYMQQTGDKVLQSLYYMRVGDVFVRLDRMKDAMNWFQKSTQGALTKNTQVFWYKSFLAQTKLLIYENRAAQAETLINKITGSFPPATIFDQLQLAFVKAECYAALGRIPEAEKQYGIFLSIADHFPAEHIHQEFPNVYIHLSRFYFNQKKYRESRLFAQKCFDMTTKRHSIGNLSLSHLMFFRLDSVEGNYQSAIRNYQTYKTLADSLNNIHQKEKYDQLLVEYQTVKKDQHISKLKQNGMMQDARLRQSDFEKKLTLAGISILLIFSGVLFQQFRAKQKSNLRLEKQRVQISQKNQALQELVEEKEWLLKEVHHRVKNNLHTIVSLLEHQSDFLTSDALAAIRDSQHRVFSMSLIHQKLYLSENVTTIRFAEYVGELTAYLAESFKTQHRIMFDVKVDPIDLDVGIAIPLGLILNEAVTNAIKYAFADAAGKIEIKGSKTNDHYRLMVSDNGCGLPDGFDETKSDSLGFKLMRGLSKEIDAEFFVSSGKGTRIIIALSPETVDSMC